MWLVKYYQCSTLLQMSVSFMTRQSKRVKGTKSWAKNDFSTVWICNTVHFAIFCLVFYLSSIYSSLSMCYIFPIFLLLYPFFLYLLYFYFLYPSHLSFFYFFILYPFFIASLPLSYFIPLRLSCLLYLSSLSYFSISVFYLSSLSYVSIPAFYLSSLSYFSIPVFYLSSLSYFSIPVFYLSSLLCFSIPLFYLCYVCGVLCWSPLSLPWFTCPYSWTGVLSAPLIISSK